MIQCLCEFLRILVPLNLLFVRSHQAEIIVVKRPIQGRNNVIRVRVEPGLFDPDIRINNAFTLLATLPTRCFYGVPKVPKLHH